ncbi:MAG: M23 family metallopeptidase, partial [Patescibacteria group bacterium]
ILSWPIKGAVLTQGFGTTPYSKVLYNGKPHNGIDIKAPIGTEIFSAEGGVVKEIGDTDQFGRNSVRPCLSYGKWVLLEHPNNLSTLYAHLSLIRVQKGDIIKRGDLIGYSGSTGYAVGPHLHFTVYDSSTVQFGPSKIPRSTCSFLPFGGYLNPLAYL